MVEQRAEYTMTVTAAEVGTQLRRGIMEYAKIWRVIRVIRVKCDDESDRESDKYYDDE